MRKKVFITRKMPEEILEKLNGNFQVSMWEGEHEPVPKSVLMKEIKESDAVFSMLTDSIDKEVLSCSKKLKIISNMAVGYNNIDIKEAENMGITVTNTPDVLTNATADLTFALLMGTARRIVEASELLKMGKWGAWSPFQLTGQEISGATIGIIGLGRIGQAISKRAKGFDMDVLYYNRSRKVELEKELGITYNSLNDLLKKSDYVCIMIPYSQEVHHLIGEKELGLMKKSAILINTSRGGIVDEAALYKALENKVIWGAGLDVFEEEPISMNHPLLTLPNVVALPHIGSASINTRMKMAHLAVDNIISFLNEQKSITPIRNN